MSAWSTQQLAEFLAAVSASQTESAAALIAVERAAEALDAEVAAIVAGGEVMAVVGYPEGAAVVADLEAVTLGSELSLPGIGICPATAVPLEHPPGARFVLARSGPEGLNREEAALLRGMARVASITMRMLRLLDDERAAREQTDRQAVENAHLLATLSDRQAALARLAEEQAALRRVATLVAGQTPPDQIIAAVAEEVAGVLRADACTIGRYESDRSLTVMGAWADEGSAYFRVGERVVLENASIATVVQDSGQPARVDDYAGRADRIGERMRALAVRSVVAGPIVVGGRLWGVMVTQKKQPEMLPADTEQRLAAFTELVATAISNAAGRSQLAASRARIVATADETRRRIERDLHDGIQQRLVTLTLEVRTAMDALPSERRELMAEVAEGLTTALDELREVARGVHPAVLSEGGLGPALRSVVRRSVLPVRLDMGDVERLPPPVEVAAYYAVCEALTNAAKHARASAAEVKFELRNGALRVSITDDGVGGADPARGSGIIGLADRVEAMGGVLAVTSPPGAGTSMTLELPTRGR
jgi:signal transduction histidine kinase